MSNLIIIRLEKKVISYIFYFQVLLPDGVIGSTTGFGPVSLGSSPGRVAFSMRENKDLKRKLENLSNKEVLAVYHYAFQMRKAQYLINRSSLTDINHWLQKVFDDKNFDLKKRSQFIKGEIYKRRICLLEKNKGLFLYKGATIPFMMKDSLAHFQQNELAVGDYALFSFTDGIYHLETPLERNNCLARKHPHKKYIEKAIASNIDLIFIISSVAYPKFNPYVIDRFLIAAQNSQVKEIIIGINKEDLMKKEKLIDDYIKTYEGIGIEAILYSTKIKNNIGLERIKKLLKNKTSIFIGHSGVGKSSTINAINKKFQLKIGENKSDGRGRHTTNKSQLYQIVDRSFIIDSPGMREFDYISIKEEEVVYFFPEFFPFMESCSFDNCSHTKEKNCEVKNALVKNLINKPRYMSYKKILEEIKINNKLYM